jgi:glycosyltransferase involved in cell wall biosynthesis
MDPADGGPPRVAVRLAVGAANLGHDVTIIYHETPNAREAIKKLFADVPGSDLIHHHLLPPRNRLTNIFLAKLRREIDRIIDGYDIVHVHSVWDGICRSAMASASKHRVPFVMLGNGMFSAWSLRQSRLKKRLALATGVRGLLNHAAFLQALGLDEKEEFLQLGLTSPIEIIPNGIDPDEFHPLPKRGLFYAAHPQLKGRPYIVFMSRLHHKKGLDYLAAAFAEVAPLHPDVQLVVAGPDEGARTGFENDIRAAGLADRTHIVGPLFGRDRFTVLRDGACFCLPSRQEGFSVAILEAMACGIPVVISEACNFPKLAEIFAGDIVPLEPHAIAKALNRILSVPALGHRMSNEARMLVYLDFTWPEIAKRLVAAYERAINPTSLTKSQTLSIVHYLPDVRLEQGGEGGQGNIAKAVLDWCEVFAARGHRVTLITVDPKDVPADWLNQQPGKPLIAAPQQAEAIIRQADLLHLHAPWLSENRQFAKLAGRHGVPYLVTIHGILDDWSMSQRSLKTKISLKLQGRRFLNAAATIHCTTAGELQQASKWFDNPKTVVLPYLVDMKPFENLPGPQSALTMLPPQHRDVQKILFLSRLHEKNGVDILIRAAAVLHDQNKSFVLLIAGSGDPTYERHLKKLTADLKLTDHVHFLGQVTGVERLSLFQSADLFVLPTQHENFGLVLIEALACGTPVITTRGADIWPQLQEAGAVITDRTPPAIAAAIIDLLSNPANLKSIGLRGRQWAFDHLAFDPLVKKYETLYSDLAKK